MYLRYMSKNSTIAHAVGLQHRIIEEDVELVELPASPRDTGNTRLQRNGDSTSSSASSGSRERSLLESGM